MAASKTKDEILDEMHSIMPFEAIGTAKTPYIKEAMQYYADQEAKAFAHWLEYNQPDGRTTEQLYKAYQES